MYVLNETMPHTLAIHYPVHLPCDLQILSTVHKIVLPDDCCLHETLSCNRGFELTHFYVWFKNYVIRDFEGRINRKCVRSRQFPFPSMGADERNRLGKPVETKIVFYRE